MKQQNKTLNFLANNGVIILMIVLVIITGILKPNFFKVGNWTNIIGTMSYRLVIALGIAGCIITAGCDLSAGRMIGFGACLAGVFLQNPTGKMFPNFPDLPVPAAALVAMIVCGCLGCVTGFFIAFLHVPPFISTMAMMEIVYGVNSIFTGSKNVNNYVEAYLNLNRKTFLGLTYLIWVALGIAAITWFIFNMTRHGKYMYAIGGNPQAAEVAGVPVKLTLVLIYMKAAMFYGLAGFMIGARAGGVSVNTGLGYEMEAIAACTIGGVSVSGGRGRVSSAFIGVAVFEILKTALQFLGVNAYAQFIALGVIIYIAISLDIRKYVAKK